MRVARSSNPLKSRACMGINRVGKEYNVILIIRPFMDNEKWAAQLKSYLTNRIKRLGNWSIKQRVIEDTYLKIS